MSITREELARMPVEQRVKRLGFKPARETPVCVRVVRERKRARSGNRYAEANRVVEPAGRDFLDGYTPKRGCRPISADDRAAFERSLSATDDPFDRAHLQHGADGKLVAAAREVRKRGVLRGVAPVALHGARPRRYPPAYTVRTREGTFSVETAMDDLHERRVRLEGVAGIGVNVTRFYRGGQQTGSVTRAPVVELRERAIDRLGHAGFRDLTRTQIAKSDDERRQDAAVRAWARSAGVRV